MKNLSVTLGTALCGITLITGIVATGCSSTSEKRSAGTTMDDAGITASVKTDILRDPLIKNSSINVDTYNGNVQLHGFVNSQQEKQEAEQIARRANGVKSVQNTLQIKSEAAGAGQ